MITNPSTLGLFDENIQEIERIFHGAGALMYYDGANMNAVCGIARPGRHGLRRHAHQPAQDVLAAARRRRPGRRAGRGARASSSRSCPCPPSIRNEDGSFGLDFDRPKTIGKVRAFPGSSACSCARTRTSARTGPRLREMPEKAVLNANYLLARLKGAYDLPYDRLCMHEFVLSARTLKREHGVTALDVAKRLMDYGFHPPTVYFPLIVPEALMIEPTETEPKETLDEFCDAMLAIAPRRRRSRSCSRGAAQPAGDAARRGEGGEAVVVKYGFDAHPNLSAEGAAGGLMDRRPARADPRRAPAAGVERARAAAWRNSSRRTSPAARSPASRCRNGSGTSPSGSDRLRALARRPAN